MLVGVRVGVPVGVKVMLAVEDDTGVLLAVGVWLGALGETAVRVALGWLLGRVIGAAALDETIAATVGPFRTVLHPPTDRININPRENNMYGFKDILCFQYRNYKRKGVTLKQYYSPLSVLTAYTSALKRTLQTKIL